MIVQRVRPVKPNFSMGRAELDYTSENKGRLQEPGAPTYDKSTLDKLVATQRKHNFKMSFEQGS